MASPLIRSRAVDAVPARPRPIVTANQVTLTRLVLLPFGSWLMYQGTNGQWAALVFMTLVGCTDFVDGFLARRYGPTVLGGLMDPIADKVFVTVTLLPMIDLGWLPGYIVGLVFLREFIITAARTAYSRRDVSLRTSYLAKVKTWYQMIVAGLIFMLRISPVTVRWVMAACCVGALAGGLVFYAIKRRIWRGSVVFTISFGVLGLVALVMPGREFALFLGWITVAITWASGGAYLFGLRDLVGTGRADADDLVRLFGAVTLPVLACAIISTHRAPVWPLLLTVALEFAVGGLDNLLAHHHRLPSWQGWAARVVPQALLLGVALFFATRDGSDPLVIQVLLWASLAVTAVSVAIAFWRFRDVYLGAPAAAPLENEG